MKISTKEHPMSWNCQSIYRIHRNFTETGLCITEEKITTGKQVVPSEVHWQCEYKNAKLKSRHNQKYKGHCEDNGCENLWAMQVACGMIQENVLWYEEKLRCIPSLCMLDTTSMLISCLCTCTQILIRESAQVDMSLLVRPPCQCWCHCHHVVTSPNSMVDFIYGYIMHYSIAISIRYQDQRRVNISKL